MSSQKLPEGFGFWKQFEIQFPRKNIRFQKGPGKTKDEINDLVLGREEDP